MTGGERTRMNRAEARVSELEAALTASQAEVARLRLLLDAEKAQGHEAVKLLTKSQAEVARLREENEGLKEALRLAEEAYRWADAPAPEGSEG